MAARRERLTRLEVAAMWLYGEEYSKQKLGVKEWYPTLEQHQKIAVREMVTQITTAEVDDGR